MVEKKQCSNCRFGNRPAPYNANYKCIPCKRGKYVRDNWEMEKK